MRTRKKRTIILILAAAAMVLATGAYVSAPKGVASLEVLANGERVEEELSVYVDTDVQLECKASPARFEGRQAEYMIADETIATVDEDGLVHGVKDGETLLTIEYAGVRKNYNVAVLQGVRDITGLEEEITLTEGDEYQLEPEVKMADKELDAPAITYKSKRTTIAEVDQDGKITAVGEGTTRITVKAGSVSKKVKVTVEAAPEVTTPVYTAPQTTDTGDNQTATGGNNNTGNNKGRNNGKKNGSGKNGGGKTGGNTGGNNGGSGSSGGNTGGSGDSGSGSGSDSGSGSSGGNTGGSGDSGSSGGDSGSGSTEPSEE